MAFLAILICIIGISAALIIGWSIINYDFEKFESLKQLDLKKYIDRLVGLIVVLIVLYWLFNHYI